MNYPKEILSEYLSGKSTVVLSKEYGIHYSCIRRFLIANGIKLRSNKENSRVYTVNDDAFSEISTEEGAYWLGFLFADGYVSSVNGKRVGLAISTKDKNHLNKFNKFIESDYPIHTYKASGYSENEYCRVIVSSDKMYDDLVSHGVVEHKSKILEFPKTVPEHLQRHFIRGYIDGDGCITKNGGRSYALKIMGTDCFLSDVIHFLQENGVYKRGKIEKRKEDCTVKSLNMFGETAFGAIRMFYGDSNIYLDRKFEIASNAICYFSRLYQ